MQPENLSDRGWRDVLAEEFSRPYFKELSASVEAIRSAGTIVHPPAEEVFAAFNTTPFDAVKVVILGQDPYHGAGQAMGLSFSVQEGVKIPPSLRNIYKEIEDDTGAQVPSSGDLSRWASQGVLLLNSVLTVEEAKAGSHAKLGWETFTDKAINTLSEKHEGLVFLLWGRHAHHKAAQVDTDRHHLLQAPHPSPLSAYRGFLGCGHFSQANALLKSAGRAPIQW